MNNKIVSVVLVAGIAATGFAGISSASESQSGFFSKHNFEAREITDEQKAEMLEKGFTMHAISENGERLNFKGKVGYGKRAGFNNFTDSEKLLLAEMSDEDKRVFFISKQEDMQEKRVENKSVINKLILGDTLTSAEESIRLEMLIKFEEHATSGKELREGSAIVAKLLAGDELTTDEQTQLAQMQEKRIEREAQHAILEPILEKKKAGEELTSEQQAVLDEMKGNRSEGRGHGKGDREGKRGHGLRGNHDFEDDIEIDEDL